MDAKTDLEFHTPQSPWLRAEGAADGIWEQQLSLDTSDGSATVLQRYEAGTDTTALGVITHTFVEEVYLISGELTDVTLGSTFSAGMYARRSPGMPHGPYTSTAGCLMLVIHRQQ